MVIKVFVLGRPGSGKTMAVRHILELANRRNYPTLDIDDYDVLYQMFREDVEHKKFRPTDYNGFDVHDFSVLDVALKQLEANVRALSSPNRHDMITIEFARDDYRSALSKFSPELLQDSYFLFPDANVETCIERIHKRVSYPPRPDLHFVSDDIMHTYYSKDNWEYMAHEIKEQYHICKTVEAIENTGTLESFIDRVSAFAEIIFQEEFAEIAVG